MRGRIPFDAHAQWRMGPLVCMYGAEMRSPQFGMFVEERESRLLSLNPFCTRPPEQLRLLGSLISIAVYNACLVDLPLAPFIYKALLGQEPTLRDLVIIQPTTARSLQQARTLPHPRMPRTYTHAHIPLHVRIHTYMHVYAHTVMHTCTLHAHILCNHYIHIYILPSLASSLTRVMGRGRCRCSTMTRQMCRTCLG
jgi:hypothetical protein